MRLDGICKIRIFLTSTHVAKTILGDIAEAILPIGIDVTVRWFVSLSHSCFVLKQQKISTRFLLHMTTLCLSQIVLKFGLHWATLSSPK